MSYEKTISINEKELVLEYQKTYCCTLR